MPIPGCVSRPLPAPVLSFRLALLGLVPSCGRPAEPAPTSVLLLTLDTTNPEALGAYGGPAGLTPHLDRLAREGVVFEDARAVAPLTLPAHASILTGLYPLRHAVRRNGETRLAEGATTLAERAREQGYQTAAFVAAVVLDPEFALAQGFERYDAPLTPRAVDEHLAASRPAAEIAARACAWLAQRERARPFFLWAHFYDPHFPYAPPREFAARARGDAYLGEVAAMDAGLGAILAQLEEEGALATTLVIALADHGEGRGRHGEETHGAFVFDATMRIPFLVRLPGAARAGERVARPVTQVDVPPLVAAVLGWGPLPDLDGRDPFSAAPADGIYFESYFGTKSFGWSPLAGWTDGAWKYVHSSAPELYDLATDPEEARDVLRLRPGEAARLRERLAALSARARLESVPLTGGADPLQREIERLGYAGVGGGEEERDPEPLADSTGPSPHRMTAAYADYMAGRKLFEEKGSRERAVELLTRALRTNPENHKAWFTLGLAELDLQRFEPAAESFRRVLAMPGAERIPAQLNLAVCLYNLAQPEAALRELEAALAETDGPPGALELLIRLLEQQGRPADAARERARRAGRGQP